LHFLFKMDLFNAITGHEKVKSTLINWAETAIPYNIIFCGPNGVGKKMLIHAFITKALFFRSTKEVVHKKKITKKEWHNHVLEIYEDQQTMNCIRSVIEPFMNRGIGLNIPYKVIVFHVGSALSREFQNGLRTIMEEQNTFVPAPTAFIVRSSLKQTLEFESPFASRFTIMSLDSLTPDLMLNSICKKDQTNKMFQNMSQLANGDMRKFAGLVMLYKQLNLEPQNQDSFIDLTSDKQDLKPKNKKQKEQKEEKEEKKKKEKKEEKEEEERVTCKKEKKERSTEKTNQERTIEGAETIEKKQTENRADAFLTIAKGDEQLTFVKNIIDTLLKNKDTKWEEVEKEIKIFLDAGYNNVEFLESCIYLLHKKEDYFTEIRFYHFKISLLLKNLSQMQIKISNSGLQSPLQLYTMISKLFQLTNKL
jgi:DNA polymerase III delta prime subunit